MEEPDDGRVLVMETISAYHALRGIHVIISILLYATFEASTPPLNYYLSFNSLMTILVQSRASCHVTEQ